MKTSEMIAMLEKDPSLKFTRSKCTFGYGGSLHLENGRLYGKSGDSYPFVLDDRNRPMDDWQIVREPVPVWDAIKALCEGKTVECEMVSGYGDNFYLRPEMLDQSDPEFFHMSWIRKGKWYIND